MYVRARVANTNTGRRWSRHSARKVMQRSAARNDRGRCTSAWRWRLQSGFEARGVVVTRSAEGQSRVAPPDFAPQRLGSRRLGYRDSETEVALVDARNLPLFVRLYCTCTSSCTSETRADKAPQRREPKIPTLRNFSTFKNYKQARHMKRHACSYLWSWRLISSCSCRVIAM